MHKIIFILTLFLSFSKCGLEVPQPIPRLYPPNGVRVFNAGAGKPSTVRLTWYGVNPEQQFSGYNIYYTDDIANATSYNGTKILCLQFNPSQATLPVHPFNVAKKFTFDITKFYYANQGELFTEGKEYWFYVKAYNQIRNIESPPSLYDSVIFKDNLD